MRHAVLAMTTVLAAASASFGAAWSSPTGSNAVFSYTNGHDFNGLLGNPTVTTTGFGFSPTTLIATSSNGGLPIDRSDTAAVDLTATAGTAFTSFTAQVAGDYSIFGTGSVDSVGALGVINLDTSAVLALPMSFTGTPSTTTTSTNGIFTGTVTVALPAGWTHVSLAVPNTITATSSAGGSSLIQTKSVVITLTTNVPEPTTLVAGLAGAGLLVRRRK